MSLDAALDAAMPDTTADAGSTSTPSQVTTTAAPSAPTAQPAAQSERSFTQAEVDRIVGERLSRKSLQEYFRSQGWGHRSEFERAQQQQQPQAQARTPQADPAEAYVQSLIDARVNERLAPLQAKEAERDLDSAISRLSSQYPDAKVNDVLEAVIELGLDRATHIPLQKVLDMAYRYTRQMPDVDGIKKQAADEAIKAYTTKKVAVSDRTPKAEGMGGPAAVSTPKRTNRRADLNRALEDALSRID